MAESYCKAWFWIAVTTSFLLQQAECKILPDEPGSNYKHNFIAQGSKIRYIVN